MTRVDKFIRKGQLYWVSESTYEVTIGQNTSNNNQNIRIKIKNGIASFLSSQGPVILLTITPCSHGPMRRSELIPEVHTSYPRVVLVASSNLPPPFYKVFFWVLICIPQSLPIIWGAAPHSCAHMVVWQDYYLCISQSFDSLIKHLHGCHSNHLWVSGESL